ncbi:MAG: hypothetical protein M1826_001396 [Phylliscum demangeonii]|nr:MAG: hypothetical protein M1826_001396 [Phylliscum demangeonii]
MEPIGSRTSTARESDLRRHRFEWGKLGQCPTGFTDYCCVRSLLHEELWHLDLQEGFGCRKYGEAPFTRSEQQQIDREADLWLERGGSVLNVDLPYPFEHHNADMPQHHQADSLAVVRQRVDQMLWKPAQAWSRRTGRVLSKGAAAAGAALRGGGHGGGRGGARPLVETNPMLRVPEK